MEKEKRDDIINKRLLEIFYGLREVTRRFVQRFRERI